MGLLWLIFASSAFGLYAYARISLGLPLTFSALILGLGLDLALACAIGFWLWRVARRWAEEERPLSAVAIGVARYSLIAYLIAAAIMAAMAVVNQDRALSDALWRVSAARWPNALADYAFFWAIAISVVPLPFLRRLRFAPAASHALVSIGRLGVAAQSLAVRNNGSVEFVALDGIHAAVAAENYVELHVDGRTVLHRATMAQMEALLPPPDFLRIHRRAIVRRSELAAIRREGKGAVIAVLRSGLTLPVSRSYRQAALAALTDAIRH
jgi:DNA-binding LytR/AlgR family response regulator